MNRPYSEATRDMIAEATEQHHIVDGQTTAMGDSPCVCGQWWDASGDNLGWDQHMAEVALDALAAAALLLPEGAETRTEWRVTGDPGDGFPPYAFTWSAQNAHLGEPEAAARGFAALIERTGGWPDGPHLSCRTVIEGPWDAVRLAEGDNKESDLGSVSVEETTQ